MPTTCRMYVMYAATQVHVTRLAPALTPGATVFRAHHHRRRHAQGHPSETASNSSDTGRGTAYVSIGAPERLLHGHSLRHAPLWAIAMGVLPSLGGTWCRIALVWVEAGGRDERAGA